MVVGRKIDTKNFVIVLGLVRYETTEFNDDVLEHLQSLDFLCNLVFVVTSVDYNCITAMIVVAQFRDKIKHLVELLERLETGKTNRTRDIIG